MISCFSLQGKKKGKSLVFSGFLCIQKLRNVLMAFSWRNPDIGYCQGLNRYMKGSGFSPFPSLFLCLVTVCFIVCAFLRLAAIALLYLDQEDAFWSLIAIVEVFMPRDYYTKTLMGSQVNKLKCCISTLQDTAGFSGGSDVTLMRPSLSHD